MNDAMPFSPAYHLKTLNGYQQHLVNARELHAALEIKKDFSDWIKRQIPRARLTQGVHFLVSVGDSSIFGGTINTSTVPIDYYLTVYAAKHIALLSRTEMGAKVRDYFIAVESSWIAQGLQSDGLPSRELSLSERCDSIEDLELEALSLYRSLAEVEARLTAEKLAYQREWDRVVGKAKPPQQLEQRLQAIEDLDHILTQQPTRH